MRLPILKPELSMAKKSNPTLGINWSTANLLRWTMTKAELDQFINDYGFDNKTDVENIEIAMNITKFKKEKEKCQHSMR